MPKPNFVKKPIDKLLDEPLKKLPDPKREVGRVEICSTCRELIEDCYCDDILPVDRDGLKG